MAKEGLRMAQSDDQRLGEFDLIREIFQPLQTFTSPDHRDSLVVGIGDDCAVWRNPGNLVFSIDTLVEGVHFTKDIPPSDLAYRALAVCLSDLAAMAAKPSFFTLALTLPDAREGWLKAFAGGLESLARQHHFPLVGGDTTRGPLTITIQVHGTTEQPILRSGARQGDVVYVTGHLGDAAAGLNVWLDKTDTVQFSKHQAYLVERFHRPTPRINESLLIAPFVNAMLDVSDGLLADLGHMAKASDFDIEVDPEKLPISIANRDVSGEQQAKVNALSGGDDYELAFTVASDRVIEFESFCLSHDIDVTKVGSVVAKEAGDKAGVARIIDGSDFQVVQSGYRHF